MFKNFFLCVFFITTIHFVQSQKIQISGNGIEIKGNGTNKPSSLDGTKYNDVNAGDILTHSFSILNNEKRKKITIESIVVNSNEFIVTHNLKDLSEGQSGIFDVTFQPTYVGSQSATISIVAKAGNKKKTFTFNIIGNETVGNPGERLMITQYYENESIDYIEIKNLSNVTTNNKEANNDQRYGFSHVSPLKEVGRHAIYS
jgi:hypothetical protein